MDSNNRFTNNGLMNSQVASFIPNACRRCHHGGCDVKVQDCGCLFHAVSVFDEDDRLTKFLYSKWDDVHCLYKQSILHCLHDFLLLIYFALSTSFISCLNILLRTPEMYEDNRQSNSNIMPCMPFSGSFSLSDANGL